MQGAVAKAKGKIGGAVGGILGAAKGRVLGKNLEVKVGSGDQLDVRQFSIHERLSNMFQVNLIAVSKNASIDFDEVVGQNATFTMNAGQHDRFWSGICNHFEQVRMEPLGESTYQLSIVPRLWLLTQRKNYRIFTQMTVSPRSPPSGRRPAAVAGAARTRVRRITSLTPVWTPARCRGRRRAHARSSGRRAHRASTASARRRLR
ncbi:hypothetical protein E8A74_06295, partial [Polyangium fumosum]